MPTNLPKTTVKFLIALLKHQAKLWLGEDAAGIAAETILDEDIQTRLDDWLESDKTAKDLLNAVEKAQLYLQDPTNCPDQDLRHLFRDMTFGDLPTVQAAVLKIPQAMDSGKLYGVLHDAFQSDLPNLSSSQHAEGARLYTDAMLRAVGSLEEFVSPILLQTVLDLKKGQTVADKKLDQIIAFLEAKTVTERPPSPTVRGDLPIGSYLPIQPNPLFTGRDAELTQLAESLLSEDGGVIINQQALVGMSGLGKTQLAVQFAWTHGHRFAGVHWVSAFKADEIASSIAQCGLTMNLQPWPQDVNQQAEMTVNAWKADGIRLVILDNLEDLQSASAWMAKLRHTNIRILITTRQKDWPPAFGLHTIPLPTFSQDESVVFLRRYLDESRASEAELISLHIRFGGLPLPLDLAASYLQHVDKLSVAGYLEQLRLDHPSLKNWRAKYPTATQHDKDVAASFALSWERVEDENARRVFLLAGYGLPNEPLPRDVLQIAANLEDAPFSEAIDLLKGLSLLQPEPSLHSLLAEFARLQDNDHTAHFRWARILAWRCLPHGTEHLGIYRDPSLVRYIHLSLKDILLATMLKDRDPSERSALCFHSAFFFVHFGDLDRAIQLYQQALDIMEDLGDLQGKSAALHEIASINVTRGNLDEAMQLYQEALEINNKLSHTRGAAVTQGEIARILVIRGELDRALELHKQKLAAVKAIGDKREISIALTHMANIYATKGNLDDAMDLYEQSLDIATDMNDLHGKAAIMQEMANINITHGDLETALQLYYQALEIHENLESPYGKATAYHEIAEIFATRGDLSGAMKLYEQAQKIYEDLQDPQANSATLHKMAGIHIIRGNLDEALKLYQNALNLLERLGDLRGTAVVNAEIADIYFTRGDIDSAMKLYQKTLMIMEKIGDVQGKATVLNQMAGIVTIRGDIDQALHLYSESKNIFTALNDSQGISATMHNLARLHAIRDELDTAMILYQQSLEIKESLGDLKGKSATLHQLAGIHVKRGDLDNAMILYQQSLEIDDELGDQLGKAINQGEIANIYVLRGDLLRGLEIQEKRLSVVKEVGDKREESRSLHQIAEIHLAQGDLSGAMRLYEESLQIIEKLDDPQGVAMTLGMMSQVYWMNQQYKDSIKCLARGLQLLSELEIEPNTQQSMALDMAMLRERLGYSEFDSIWKEVTGQGIPDWLSHPRM